jgi:hypothetical protein
MSFSALGSWRSSGAFQYRSGRVIPLLTVRPLALIGAHGVYMANGGMSRVATLAGLRLVGVMTAK